MKVPAILRNRTGLVSTAVLGVIVLLAVFGPMLAPLNPLAQDARHRLQGITAQHWLGTDQFGRDLLSRLLTGSPLSIMAAVEGLACALVLGLVPALLSLVLDRRLGWLTQQIMDAFVALPFIVFAVAMAALLGNGLYQAMLAAGILMSPAFYRVTRALGMPIMNAPYVDAARLMGAGPLWVLRVHLLRKVLPAVGITAAVTLGNSLVVMSSLTFLGIGVEPPSPTWGGILADQIRYLYQQPFAVLPPALLIIATVAASHGLADALRQVTGGTDRPMPLLFRKARLGGDHRLAR